MPIRQVAHTVGAGHVRLRRGRRDGQAKALEVWKANALAHPAAAVPLHQPSALARSGPDIWIADAASNSLTEVRAASGTEVRRVTGAGYGFADPVALAVDGTDLFVANRAGNSVTEVDATTGAPVRILRDRAYGLRRPDALAASGPVVAAAGAGDSLTEFSASDGRDIVRLDGTRNHLAGPAALAVVRPDVWVVNETDNSLTVINRRTGALVRRVT
jgi:DNA-binding beta-propeller fold protein YncE